MKYLKLYNTTAAMTADLENLETPYIAVADDNLNNPVIQGYVAPVQNVKVYISTDNAIMGIDENYIQDDVHGLFLDGEHLYTLISNGNITETQFTDGIEFAGDTLPTASYIEVPAGSVLKFCYGTSAASNVTFQVLNLEDSSITYQDPQKDGEDMVLEYTIKNDIYLNIAGDFS